MTTSATAKTLRRTGPAWLLAAGMTAAAGGAQAASYLETFSGPLDPAIWTLTSAGNEVGTAGGELVFARLTAETASLRFVPQLVGDFDVSFSYRLIDWVGTYGFGDRLQLDVNNPLPSARGHAVGRAQEGSHFGAVDSGCCSFAPAAGTTGALRITRADGLVTVAFDQGGGWQTLGQSTPDLQDMTLSFTAYIFNGFLPGTGYAIDDFSIWAEGFSQPVPEPAAGAMLLAGLATLGWAARRRRTATPA